MKIRRDRDGGVLIDDAYYPPRLPVTVPADRVLVHNTVRPARRQGARGFRYWLQSPSEKLEICSCGWAPELAEHYRIKPRVAA
jgi:hypothetical protein